MTPKQEEQLIDLVTDLAKKVAALHDRVKELESRIEDLSDKVWYSDGSNH